MLLRSLAKCLFMWYYRRMKKNRTVKNPFIRQIPNILSAMRIAIAIAIMFIPPYETAFYVIYAFCGISDLFDGVIARALHIESRLGGTLDTIGDTLLTWTGCHVVFSNMEPLYPGLLAAILAVFAVRIIGAVITLCRFRKFAMLHTAGNKIAMIILYLYPFFYTLTAKYGCVQEVVYSICALGILAGIEEIVIQCLVPELDESILSVATVIKRMKAKKNAGATGDSAEGAETAAVSCEDADKAE